MPESTLRGTGWPMPLPRPAAVMPPTIVVLAVNEACARAARSALDAAELGADVARVEVGVAPPRHSPVLLVAESASELDPDELTAAVERDFILCDDVPEQLSLRVTVLRERCLRRHTRLAAAEQLRARSLELTGLVHGAPTLAKLGRVVTSELPRLFEGHAAAVAVFAPAADSAAAEGLADLGWSSQAGSDAGVLAAARDQLGERLRKAARSAAHRTIDLDQEHDAALVAALFGREARRAIAVPIVSDNASIGALLLADTDTPPRRTRFERDLIGYLGMQVGRAADELRLQERERLAQKRLHETSAELQRLVDEMDDLGVVIRSIADSVNVGVLFYDIDNRPKLNNRMVEEFLTLTGFDAETGLSAHVYASDRRTRVKQDKNIISETLEGDQRGLIYWIGDPEGEQRAIVTEAHVITRPGGERLGSAVVTYDVTDLANAIEIREEYLATVSHELRTPLTSIVGYLDLIDDGFDVEGLGFGKEFRTIQRSTEQMLALIRDLLSTSTRELTLRIEPADLSALLAQSVSGFRPAVGASHQRLELRLPQTSVLAHIDSGRVKQIVDNLISNAVKYTPDGGTITVSLDREEDFVVLTVADTGRGISRTDQSRLFDRFFRARDVRDAAIQGVGIGLTIVKTIVDAHGGTIGVTSEPGHGSTFIVRLPLRAGTTPLPTLPMQP